MQKKNICPYVFLCSSGPRGFHRQFPIVRSAVRSAVRSVVRPVVRVHVLVYMPTCPQNHALRCPVIFGAKVPYQGRKLPRCTGIGNMKNVYIYNMVPFAPRQAPGTATRNDTRNGHQRQPAPPPRIRNAGHMEQQQQKGPICGPS